MVKWCSLGKCRPLRCSDVDLTHDDQSAFFKSQIPIARSHWIAIIWNALWCVLLTIALFMDIFYDTKGERHLWLVHLDNWAYLLCVTVLGLETGIRTVVVLRGQTLLGDAGDLRWYLKVQWVFFNVNNVMAPLITVLYFSFYSIDLTFGSVSKHLLTTFYVFINLSVISSCPLKVLHFYQPTTFLIVYVVFISIYQTQIETRMFLLFDWTEPRNTSILLLCIVFIGTPCLHILCYCVYRLRTYLFAKLSKQKDNGFEEPVTIQRDITTTDVVLEHSTNPAVSFIDLKPDCKDDITIKPSSSTSRDVFNRYNVRLFKSETDLRDYRIKNGLYCDFAKSSLILHPKRKSASDIFGDDPPTLGNHLEKTPECKGSQIIVVKKCKTCEDNEGIESDTDTDSSQCQSNASSDYLSQYISEDILAYL